MNPNDPQTLEFLASLTPEEQDAALEHLARDPHTFNGHCRGVVEAQRRRGVVEAQRRRHSQKVRKIAAAFPDRALIVAMQLIGVSERDRLAFGIHGRDTMAIARQVEELKARGYDVRVKERWEMLEDDPHQPDFRYTNTWAKVPYYHLTSPVAPVVTGDVENGG
jgi:hypothetical protein